MLKSKPLMPQRALSIAGACRSSGWPSVIHQPHLASPGQLHEPGRLANEDAFANQPLDGHVVATDT
eukprot:7298497-Lingulodinium_polyedra.AAC.1